jgi:hypothetical protein
MSVKSVVLSFDNHSWRSESVLSSKALLPKGLPFRVLSTHPVFFSPRVVDVINALRSLTPQHVFTLGLNTSPCLGEILPLTLGGIQLVLPLTGASGKDAKLRQWIKHPLQKKRADWALDSLPVTSLSKPLDLQ